ncbi:MAG: hypothetical protein OHK0012_07570 [Synechococcales cyanobacterium]
MATKDPKPPQSQQAIKALRPIQHDGKLYEPGERLDVLPDIAQILLTGGAAQEVSGV